MLLRRFCVDSVGKEKIWISDLVPLLFIDSLFQLWRNGGWEISGDPEYSSCPCSGLAA